MEDERGPGLDFSLCFVCRSRPWGAAAFHLYLFILLLNVVNVRQFPPASSRTYQLRYTYLLGTSTYSLDTSTYWLHTSTHLLDTSTYLLDTSTYLLDTSTYS